MLNKLFIYSGFLLSSLSACATNDSNTVKTFTPTEQQKITYQTALQFVGSYHYSKPQINDDFSSKAFDNYIENMDASRVYFLQEDIDRFQQYRNKLDDGIMTGDVDPAFDIFNTYHKRLMDRVQYALSLLKLPMDFSKADSFEINREKSPYCANYSEYDKLWQRKVLFECLQAKGNKNDTAKKYIDDVRKRYENLMKFAGKTKGDDIFQIYMNALLEVTDPHTNYFSPRTAEDFNQSMSLSLEGIGAQLQTEGENTQIREIIKGGPADKSKQLFAGDKIIGVAQGKDSDVVNVVDWRIDDVVSLIRGKKGTPVRLKIIPASEPNSTKFVDLLRDKIVLEEQSAKCSVKEFSRGGKKFKVGVITLPTFYIDFAAAQRGEKNYKSTTRDVKKLIDSLKTQKVQGIVIDLRNNGGGSLQEAIELTGLFIQQGPVVQVKYADGNSKVESDMDPSVYYDGPITVLVNRFSASASEIFAAAIQDYNRGIIVGERTFGKGTVQNMVDLNEFIQYNGKKLGQVKLTIAKFYRVNGGSTQHKGVTPDIELPSVFADSKFGEDASPYALPWDQIAPAPIEDVATVTPLRDKLKAAHEARMKTAPEYKYLLEDIKEFKKAEDEHYVTLDESNYKAELAERDILKKMREDARKKDRKDNKDKPDLILEESEQVLADLLQAMKK
ncbi:MAG: carboxy terminal-processing peptidase [Bacteroidota bacterium]